MKVPMGVEVSGLAPTTKALKDRAFFCPYSEGRVGSSFDKFTTLRAELGLDLAGLRGPGPTLC